MNKVYWQTSFVWVLKADLIVWVINACLFAVLTFAGLKWVSPSFFSRISLFETGVAFLVGGAVAFAGSALTTKVKGQVLRKDEEWSIDELRSSEKRANKYLILAVILFVECLIASFLGV